MRCSTRQGRHTHSCLLAGASRIHRAASLPLGAADYASVQDNKVAWLDPQGREHMNLDSELTFRGLVVHAVDVPMNRTLETGGGEVGSAAMVLIDLLTEEGVTGCSYLFCATPLVLKHLANLLSNLAPLIEGDLLAPVEIERKLQKTFRLLGPQGLRAMAVAGIDMAAWDALAKSYKMPLVRLLGGRSCRIPAYNSCGHGMIRPERAADEAQELLASGFSAIKV